MNAHFKFAYRLRKVRASIDPAFRAKWKYGAELGYWCGELEHLRQWFIDGSTDWWGIRPPTDAQKLNVSQLWSVNAVMTMHALRPSYHEELKIDRKHFAGRRILEIGNGPLAPILQFEDCERHGVDTLNNMYVNAGWPLFEYDARFLSMGAEALPYPDNYFDAVISVNALDHVDDFGKVASEMQRVLVPRGEIRFEVEYHEPTITEPLQLDDNKVRNAFYRCEMQVAVSRTGREMFTELARRFDLLPNQYDRFNEQNFVTWSGTKSF
jgi:ubiquinone/menaquinone biosynthesis C-methylase UbiE